MISTVELSARTSGPKDARILTVYVEAANSYEIEETGIGLANVLAHKRGFALTGDVKVWPITQSAWSGQYQTKIEYRNRWRGRGF